MTTNGNYIILIPSILEVTINAFKDGAKEIGNSLLMNLIFPIKKQNDDYKKIISRLEENPSYALTLDTEEFHDDIINTEDMLQTIIRVYEKHQIKSEIFVELYKLCDDMLSNAIYLGNEVSAISSELRAKEEKIAS